MVATAPRQASQFGHVGVDTGHGPVVETGGGLVAIGAAVDRAELLGGHPGGNDLAVMVAGLDLFPAGCLDRRTNRTALALVSPSYPLAVAPYFPTKRAILPNKGSAHKTGDGSASDIDSGNRGLEGAMTMDPVKRWCLAR